MTNNRRNVGERACNDAGAAGQRAGLSAYKLTGYSPRHSDIKSVLNLKVYFPVLHVTLDHKKGNFLGAMKLVYFLLPWPVRESFLKVYLNKTHKTEVRNLCRVNHCPRSSVKPH